MRRLLVFLFLVGAFGLFLMLPEERQGSWLEAGEDTVSYEGVTDPALGADLELTPTGPRQTLRGHVRLPSGEGVPGVVVRLEHAWVEEVRAVSDVDGAFELTPDEPRGELALSGADWCLLGGSRVVSASQTEDYLLAVAPPRTVTGRVVDGAQQPVKDAEVEARTPSGLLVPLGVAALPLQHEGQSALTNRGGGFRLDPVPDVEGLVLEVRAAGYRPWSQPLPSGSEAALEIALEPLD